MIITFTKPLAVVVAVLALVSGGGCTRHDADTPKADPGAATRTAAGDLLGVLKLIRQEYANAVPPAGGSVADQVEYAETELFTEQAGAKVAALRAAGDAARADKLAPMVSKIHEAVAAKAPQAAVIDDANAAIAIVEEALAGAVPDAIRGAVLATTRADQAIGAEEVVGDYRVGLVSGPPRALFRRDGETLVAESPAPAGAAYVAVVVREKRTKRPLPAADVEVVLEGQGQKIAAPLLERWGDFHQYGANMALPPDGPVTITVHVSSPAYNRHGDMLNVFVAPATATVTAHVRGGALAFDAKPVTATDQDYSVGDDLLQAVAEAGELRDAGPYRLGLIVEGKEPIWLWQDGKPVLKPVDAAATNHVEVVVVDRETGQLVPRARVTLTFLASGSAVGTATLYPLLSVFSHYGDTLALPPGTTAVRVQVTPPALGAVDRPRLAAPAEIEMPMPSRQKGSA